MKNVITSSKHDFCRRLGLERTGLLGMFLLVSTSTLSVVSIFITGSPFINWISNIENEDNDKSSNIAHVTVLMTGIILARFGKYSRFIFNNLCILIKRYFVNNFQVI